MSDAFNPYHKWLGIPPRDQPADHYRLLGIERFEKNTDVISLGADQRMIFLRQFQNGQRAQIAQQLLNDVAAARVCLLDAEKKAAYDAELTQKLTESRQPRSHATPPPVEDLSATIEFVATETKHEGPPAPFIDTQHSLTIAPRRSKKQETSAAPNDREIKKRLLILGVLSGILVLLLLGILFSAGTHKTTVRPETAQRTETNAPPAPAPPDLITDNPQPEITDWGEEENQRKIKLSKPNPSTTPDGPATEPRTTDRTPEPSVPKPTASDQPKDGAVKPSEPQADDGLSEEERAGRRLTNEYHLQEEFNTWTLANEQTRNLRQIEASLGRSGMAEGPQYQRELERRLRNQTTQIISRWMQLQRQPSDNGGPRDREFSHLNSWIVPTGLGPKVKDDMPLLVSTRKQLRDEFAARAENNPAKFGLIADICARYADLANDPEVSQLLQTVGGTLAEPPAMPEMSSLDTRQFTTTDARPPTTETTTQNPTNETSPQLDQWMEAHFRKHAQRWKSKYRDQLDEKLTDVNQLKGQLQKVLSRTQSAIKKNPQLRADLKKAQKNKAGFKNKKEPAVNRIARIKKVTQALDRAKKNLNANKTELRQGKTTLVLTVEQVHDTLDTCQRLEAEILRLRNHPNTKRAIQQENLELAPFSTRKLETESRKIDKMLKRATTVETQLNHFDFSGRR